MNAGRLSPTSQIKPAHSKRSEPPFSGHHVQEPDQKHGSYQYDHQEPNRVCARDMQDIRQVEGPVEILQLRRQVRPQVDIVSGVASLSIQQALPEPVQEQPGMDQGQDQIDTGERNRPAD